MDVSALAGSTGLLSDPFAASLATASKSDVSDVFGLGRDDFFKLFLAQLANQDPMKPVDDKEFIAQLAQFSMIDTMQEMKKVLAGTQLAQASSLLGRAVQGIDIAGAPIQGVVDRVVQADGQLLLMIGDRAIRPDAVNFVGPGPDVARPPA
jgi:flagellar basal-body rod modification protein FlgD